MPNEQRHYSNELNLESVGINLPYNMQAEQSVLGAVLLKPETLTDLVEIIRPEMFYTRQNAQIYSEMLRLFTADQTIDFVTLLDAVISDGVFPSADEAKVYLTGLAETVPSISNVKAYAQIVQEKYLVRQLMGVAKDILQDAGDEPDADLLLENAEQRIYEIRSGRDSSALTPLSSSMVETLTNLQKISGPDADKYKGIPTGFRLLDTVLTGLGRGDLIILAARPGMGKTSFCTEHRHPRGHAAKGAGGHLQSGNDQGAADQPYPLVGGRYRQSGLPYRCAARRGLGVSGAGYRKAARCTNLYGRYLRYHHHRDEGQDPPGESGPCPPQRGPDRHRLFTADERQRKERREPPAGDLGDFPFTKGAGARAECAGYLPVAAFPCLRDTSGPPPDAFGSA